jgi:hypothetical protein
MNTLLIFFVIRRVPVVRPRLVYSTEMTLTLLSLRGLKPDIFPTYATEPLTVCAVNDNRYNHNSHMAAFSALLALPELTKNELRPLFLPLVEQSTVKAIMPWESHSVVPQFAGSGNAFTNRHRSIARRENCNDDCKG